MKRVGSLAIMLVALGLPFAAPAQAGYQKVLTIGSHGTGNGQFREIGGIAAADNSIYATDLKRDNVQAFFPDGAFRAAWGGPGDSGHFEFDNPGGVAISPGGNVYVTDYGHSRVEKFTDVGGFLWSRNKGKEDLNQPYDVAVNDGSGQQSGQVYVSDNWQLLTDNPDGRIQRLGTNGDALSTWVLDPPDWGPLVGQGIGVGPAGKVWVTAFWCSGDIQNPFCANQDNRLIEYGPGGAFVRDWHVPPTPSDVAISRTGRVLVVGSGCGEICEYTQTGSLIRSFGSAGIIPSIAVDQSGNVYVTQETSIVEYAPVHPGTHVTSGPSGFVNTSDADFKYGSRESNVTYECSLDGAEFRACPSAGIDYSPLNDGQHEFRVRGTDLDGFATTAVRKWTVDTVKPKTTITAGPAQDSTISDPTPTFKFHADEADVHYGCRSYSGTQWTKWVKCTSPHTTVHLSDGYHVWEVRATDKAGNREDPEVAGSKAFRRFTVDTTARVAIPPNPVTLTPAGVADVSVTCPASEVSGGCGGTLALATHNQVTFNGQTKRWILGAANFLISPGQAKVVPVQLSTDMQQLVANNDPLPTDAIANVQDGLGNTGKTNQTFDLSAP